MSTLVHIITHNVTYIYGNCKTARNQVKKPHQNTVNTSIYR